MTLKYVIDGNTDIRKFLIGKCFSLSSVKRLLNKRENLFINGKPYDGNFNLKSGDELEISFNGEKTTVCPVNEPVEIVYEDEFFLAVIKPKGLSTIPSRAHFTDNLASRVLYYYQTKGEENGIHVINRLDRLTKGIVVFAKSAFIQSEMREVKIEKKYRCTVCGKLENEQGIVNLRIGRIEGTMKREVTENGQDATTLYRVVSEKNDESVLDVTILTGRTHQIRVHFSYLGCPLKGDVLYNDKATSDEDFDLCSYYVAFTFPLNGKMYELKI